MPDEAVRPIPESFEFSPEQEASFAGLATGLRFAGRCEMVLGAMQVVLAVTGYATSKSVNISFLIAGLTFLLVGWWTTTAARPLVAVVQTRGRDVPHLMDAVFRLTKVHAAIGWVLAFAAVATGIELGSFLAKIIGRATGSG